MIMIAESNVEFVYVLQMVVDGETELIDVFRDEKNCKDRAADIAEYAELPEDEGSDGYSWSSQYNGTCIWIDKRELI